MKSILLASVAWLLLSFLVALFSGKIIKKVRGRYQVGSGDSQDLPLDRAGGRSSRL